MKYISIFILIFTVLDIGASYPESSCGSPINSIPVVDSIIKKMTLEQKVGQIIMPDIDEVSPSEAREYQLGTILNGGGKFPNKNKYSSVSDWKNLSKEFYNSSPIVDGKLVPILWGTDAVHGHNNVIGATIFPHNIGLGSTMNPLLIKSIGDAVAKELLSTGIIWTFAPTIAVPQNDLWGRTYEGYSENPILVSELGKAMILGLQGDSKEFLDENHVLATAKHFLGDGGTADGIDQGNTILSEKDLIEVHGKPYFSAIDACIQSVMASFNSWNGIKMHGNEYFLNDILRVDMGFDGLVVGDWNGHGQIPGCTKSSCPESFNAGVDIFMVPDEWKLLYKNTLNQVKQGIINESRLDDAVRKILTVKFKTGLLDGRKPHEYSSNNIGSVKHRQIARQAVRESMVLLKNNENVLPIQSQKHILVVGEASRNIKNQMGGWTITWQGRDNSNSDFPNTLSIYEAIKSKVESIGGTIEYSSNGSFETKPDVVIFVYGEEPYAEGDGDRKNLFFNNNDKNFLNYMQNIKSLDIETVSLFLSGRPLIVNHELNLSDAFVQLWLPGTAVEGISDVIFTKKDNKIDHDFSGKLSFSWPKTSDQKVLNKGDKQYDPLFAYGYGLSYSDEVFVTRLLEENKFTQPNEITVFLGSAYPSYHEVVSYFSSQKKEEVYDGVNSDIYFDEKSGLKISKFDYKKQDDAKQIDFGKNNTYKTWRISGSHENISYMKNGAIQIVLKPQTLSNESISLSFGCFKDESQINESESSDCYKSIDISNYLRENFDTKWKELNIPIKCLDNNDFELSHLTNRAQLSTSGNWKLDIHSIKYINNQGYNSCSINISDYE